MADIRHRSAAYPACSRCEDEGVVIVDLGLHSTDQRRVIPCPNCAREATDDRK